jgi:hypothetical protein
MLSAKGVVVPEDRDCQPGYSSGTRAFTIYVVRVEDYNITGCCLALPQVRPDVDKCAATMLNFNKTFRGRLKIFKYTIPTTLKYALLLVSHDALTDQLSYTGSLSLGTVVN